MSDKGPQAGPFLMPGGAEMSKRYPRRDYRRDRLRERYRALGLPCHICGLPIDYDRRTPDPLSYELDEIVPVSRGGAVGVEDNAAPAHRCCNQFKAARSPREVAALRAEVARRYGAPTTPAQWVAWAKACARAKPKAPRGPAKASRQWA